MLNSDNIAWTCNLNKQCVAVSYSISLDIVMFDFSSSHLSFVISKRSIGPAFCLVVCSPKHPLASLLITQLKYTSVQTDFYFLLVPDIL